MFSGGPEGRVFLANPSAPACEVVSTVEPLSCKLLEPSRTPGNGSAWRGDHNRKPRIGPEVFV